MADQVCVGAIAGAFGVRGEVRLKSFCADPEAIAGYSPLTGDNGVSYSVTISRPISNGFAAWLGGVETKEQADALRGVQLFAPRAPLPVPEDEEYYHADLIGLRVETDAGETLGAPQIEISGLSVAPRTPFAVALKSISMQVRAGEVLAIAGVQKT